MKEVDEHWESIAPQLLQYHDTVPKAEQAKVAREIRQKYFGGKPINRSTLSILVHLVGDRIFGADSVKAAKLQARVNYNIPVWYYYFNYKPAASFTDVLSKSKENLGKFFH